MSEKLTAIERLEEQLNEKDARIEELEEQVRALEGRVDQADAGWSLPEKLPAEQTLPVPRLEMVWQKDGGDSWYRRVAVYRLVYRHFLGHCMTLPLGRTTVEGGQADGEPIDHDGKISLPFRDGTHIHHDAAHLKLPAFAVLGDRADPLPAGWWSCKCESCSTIRTTDALMGGETEASRRQRVKRLSTKAQ